ncbi:hypothetical protein CFC21_018076 [Triticum aestivum]|uniref:Uncharacterized protein n=4 Tax=Triticum TaxID=4564 RepID=A0A9R1NZW1_TRITD|nr:uncharacterized protein LOC119359706 [Triticum dicoccoides]XP_044453487.1 uncharacterized protein LOC123185721 [Triticum aestivum]XP_048553054.1 uncharacterized protein LOC125533734 [Triticum urartu]KAF7002604.1 hypothetical protein CFC21_018076 [Triticum aestivum]VAH34265.1 unnamed protein product [Triticum turgidum subsp. durum]
MVRDTGGALQLLAVLLLVLASELATFSCGHRIPRADVAAWKRGATPTGRTASTTTTTTATRAGGAAAAALGDSKRLVPQGPNPLHN